MTVEDTLWVQEEEEVLRRRALHIVTRNNWPKGSEDISHYQGGQSSRGSKIPLLNTSLKHPFHLRARTES